MHLIAGGRATLAAPYSKGERRRYHFASGRGNQLARSRVNKICEPMPTRPPTLVNPHMLRHGCGFFMINNGHDIWAIQIYLDHASIANTTIYTKPNEKQFVGMWGRTIRSHSYNNTMEHINTETANIRRSMLFFAMLKVLLLFIGSESIRVSGASIDISDHFDRIIFVLTMVLGWKIIYFLYAATGGMRGVIESSNHVIAALFAFFPIVFSLIIFVLAYGVWVPVLGDFFTLDMWAYRK